MKKGLVMEGGAMRGMFTCGVIDVFLENGIEFDGAVGVSAGAAFGINFKSRQIGRALRYNKQYMSDKRYCSFKNLIKTGDLFDAEFCYDTLPHKLDIFDEEALIDNPMEFYAVATDANTGKPVYHKITNGRDDDLLWIRASASIPMVSKAVEVDGYELLDGGIADSIPLKFMQDKGYEKNVVILTRPFGYVRPSGQFDLASKLFLRKYPAMIRAMKERYLMYNDETEYIREQELAGKILVIRPPKDLKIPNLTKDPEVLQNAYDVGRKIALEKLEKIRNYLK